MTNANRGKYSEVKSDNSNAVLSIQWPGHKHPGVYITIPGVTMDFSTDDIIRGARIKINGKVSTVKMFQLSSGNYREASIDISPNEILRTSGDLWFEIPLFRGERRVFKFTIEPDSITKSIPEPKKTEPKKTEPKKTEPEKTEPERREPDIITGRDSAPSSGYSARVSARIKSNIAFAGDIENSSPAEVEITAGPNGKIIMTQIVKPSNNRAWNDAVTRAIEKTEVLPRDTNGRVPRKIIITFRAKD
jgi:TonB family protein